MGRGRWRARQRTGALVDGISRNVKPFVHVKKLARSVGFQTLGRTAQAQKWRLRHCGQNARRVVDGEAEDVVVIAGQIEVRGDRVLGDE